METLTSDGCIISVFVNKGGVAKTTTSLSIAHALSILGIKTLIIDVDPQCNATSSLSGHGSQNNLMDLMSDKIDVEKSIRPVTAQKGLFCIPSTKSLVALEPKIFKMGADGFFVLRNRIKNYCKKNFQITIIDCPPGFGVFTMNALATSDLAIIPVEAGSDNSIEGLITSLELIEDMRQGDNENLKFLKMLVTRVNNKTLIDKSTIAQLRDLFGDKVFSSYIPTNVDFKYAENKKQSIFQYKPKAAGAIAYMAVAQELLDVLSIKI